MSDDLPDLARRLSLGAVVTDDEVIEGYRRDRAATVPAGRPRAVVRPSTVAEVSSTLRWATENGVPVVPRGAGTGLSGGANAIDGCLVLSLGRLTAIREINARNQRAVVEAGVLNADLGRAAAAAEMFYPPDPGSFEICTIGGNLATNAGGSDQRVQMADALVFSLVTGSSRICLRIGRPATIGPADPGHRVEVEVGQHSPARGLASQRKSMNHDPLPGDHPETERVSTGELPPDTDVQALISAGYERYRHLDEGAVADYIPALAAASPGAFGVCVAGVRGGLFSIGDADQEFAIESISKLFVFALVCHTLGHEEARRKLGVNSTGLPFNSVMAIELNADRTMNPLVNAGAMATTSLVPGTTADEKFENIVASMSRFAGRRLVIDDDVYESEAATNDRNRGIAHLLDGYGRMYCDPDLATEVYTRQCSVRVSARDLAVMGATLANGGVNPVTDEQAIETRYCKRVLAVLATAGLYEHSGQWLYDVGLPGKSGVAGGIVTVSPGKGGLGTFSPPLDAAGNSVRGQHITRYLSEALGLNLFASAPTA